jgi:hypothetical protein
MFENKIYAGIGSRETPTEVIQVMKTIAFNLAHNDWTLRSGHAPGADQAFEIGCKMAGGDMEIYLPWNGFEGADHDGVSYFTGFYSKEIQDTAEKAAAHFHPNWGACSQGARKMHTRNVQQVFGKNLTTPVDLVICWTKGGKRGGGTGQALRIADYYKIPIFDLAVHTVQQLQDFLNTGALP